MEKVLSKIGKFFKAIWNWVKNTAWVQPLLIVVIIFGLIFSIQPIIKGIKSATASTDTSGKFYSDHDTKYYNLFEGKKYIEKNQECLVVYVDLVDSSKKSTALSLEAPLKNFYKTQNALYKQNKENKSVKIFVINVGADSYVEHVKNSDGKYDGGKKYNNEIYEELKSLYETSLPESNYTYSIKYPDWNEENGYLNGEGANSTDPKVNCPTYVKYVNGKAVDVRFNIKNYKDSNDKALEPITVLTDLWNNGNKATF